MKLVKTIDISTDFCTLRILSEISFPKAGSSMKYSSSYPPSSCPCEPYASACCSRLPAAPTRSSSRATRSEPEYHRVPGRGLCLCGDIRICCWTSCQWRTAYPRLHFRIYTTSQYLLIDKVYSSRRRLHPRKFYPGGKLQTTRTAHWTDPRYHQRTHSHRRPPGAKSLYRRLRTIRQRTWA